MSALARRRGVVVVVAMQECPVVWMDGWRCRWCVCVCVCEGVCVWVTYLVLRYL